MEQEGMFMWQNALRRFASHLEKNFSASELCKDPGLVLRACSQSKMTLPAQQICADFVALAGGGTCSTTAK